MEFKAGDEIWFIKKYWSIPGRIPYCRWAVRKGILKSVNDVKVFDSDRKTLLCIERQYKIKGLSETYYKVYATEEEANIVFENSNLRPYRRY